MNTGIESEEREREREREREKTNTNKIFIQDVTVPSSNTVL